MGQIQKPPPTPQLAPIPSICRTVSPGILVYTRLTTGSWITPFITFAIIHAFAKFGSYNCVVSKSSMATHIPVISGIWAIFPGISTMNIYRKLPSTSDIVVSTIHSSSGKIIPSFTLRYIFRTGHHFSPTLPETEDTTAQYCTDCVASS